MRRIIICYIIILAAIVIDQATKYIVRSNMVIGQSIPVIENVFHITYFRNTGAAFGILQGQTTFLTLFPIILIVGIFIFLTFKTKGSHFTFPLALALICSGGLGNLIDRIRFGAVVDFADFRVFPIFNVADSLVVIGCGLLIIYMFFFDKEKSDGAEIHGRQGRQRRRYGRQRRQLRRYGRQGRQRRRYVRQGRQRRNYGRQRRRWRGNLGRQGRPERQ